MSPLTSPDRIRIAAQAVCSPRTVSRVYSGAGTDFSRERVARAARELGLPVPIRTDSERRPREHA